MKLRKQLRRSFVLLTLLSLMFPVVGDAWNDKTHMAIAYIAYRNLSHHARERVDEVLVLHPLYSQWTQGAKLGEAGLYAFVHAATWADCIQNSAKCPGYVADGPDNGMTPPPTSQEAWQNIGFSDRLMHKYWHFILQPYAVDNQPTQEAPRPNLETQLQLFIDTLNSNAEDSLKSYDLAWVENLVGELHQPLNCISRFSRQHPGGDRNGREVKLCKAPCTANLHEYWDNLLGAEDDFASGMRQGKSFNSIPNPTGWFDAVDLPKWINESFELAIRVVYSPAILAADSSGDSVEPDEMYRKVAIRTASDQAVLAGHRLATLLNNNLR